MKKPKNKDLNTKAKDILDIVTREKPKKPKNKQKKPKNKSCK